MRECPILFQGDLVRAILAGTKTVTRRPLLPMPGIQRRWLTAEGINASPKVELATVEGALGASLAHPKGGPLGWIRCPYGATGDRLWVRETWQPIWATEAKPPHGYASREGWAISYPATDGVKGWHDEDRGLVTTCKPAIHMPRAFSRLLLEVVDVRVERLRAITEDDARAEGLRPSDAGIVLQRMGESPSGLPFVREAKELANTARGAFACKWDAIYGRDEALQWEASPWVWRVAFKRIEASS